MKTLQTILVTGILVLFASCATEQGKANLKSTSASVSEIRKATSACFGAEPRRISENGRELYSQYYDDRGIKIDNPTKVESRWYSKVVILGDRRPYDIAVNVIKESKNGSDKFVVEEDNSKKAEELAHRIKDRLHQSLENRNIIDDFHAF